MIKQAVKFIKALNGNLKKEQIAAGFSWGLLLGLVPAGNIFWIVFFVVSFFFRHHHWTKILFMMLVKILLGLLNPAIDSLGWELLHFASLQPLFTLLYNMPLVPLSGFNNTLVAGGLFLGIVLWLPVFILGCLFVPFLRNTLLPGIRNSKIFKTILKFPLFPVLDQAIKAASGG